RHRSGRGTDAADFETSEAAVRDDSARGGESSGARCRMMSLRCREVAAFLPDHLDGTLGAEQRTAFEAHLASCPECVAYLRGSAETLRLVRQTARDELEPGGIPDELTAAVLAARANRPH